MQKEFIENFKGIQSNLKEMKIFNGNHTEERPEELITKAFEFIKQIFYHKSLIL